MKKPNGHSLPVLFIVFSLFYGAMTPLRARAADPWERLSFLVGNWAGGGSGKPSDAVTGWTRFSMELDGKVMVRKNRAELAAKPGESSGTVHEDLMIVYPKGGGSAFLADYFDSEGHVIHYALSFPEDQPSVVFESDSTAAGPRFRLVYAMHPPETGTQTQRMLVNEFWIAPPAGEFRMYLRGELRKID